MKPDDTVLKISYEDRSQLCVEAACHSENVIRCKTSQGATMVLKQYVDSNGVVWVEIR